MYSFEYSKSLNRINFNCGIEIIIIRSGSQNYTLATKCKINMVIKRVNIMQFSLTEVMQAQPKRTGTI